MAEVIELSAEEFKTTMFNMLEALIDKVDSKQDQMGNVNREMEVIRNKKKC